MKILLKNKSWEELCQTAFGDVVDLLEHIDDNTNEPRLSCDWGPVIPNSRNRCAPNWDEAYFPDEDWDMYLDLI